MSAFDERHWTRLTKRIREKRCTPFLGAGASAKFLPVAADVAREWAEETDYPLPDATDLARVAQYVAVQNDPMWPKEQLAERFRAIPTPDLSAPDDPHRVLAAMELPFYITTNYDDFMAQALRERGKRPREAICLWNDGLARGTPPALAPDPAFVPSPDEPLVYHLHGHLQVPESLVLTEDDYLAFLINLAANPMLVPPPIQERFTTTSLLFVGYRLADWNFRVLFRNLATYIDQSIMRAHFSVQTVPGWRELSEEAKQRAQLYLDDYFDQSDIRVFWGQSDEFAVELDRRWREAAGGA